MSRDVIQPTKQKLSSSQIIKELCGQGRVMEMNKFMQHGSASTLEHVIHVAETSLAWAHRLHLDVREYELIRGAMLHDYYLYDWHDPNHTKHAFEHPLHAAVNAAQDFELSELEYNIITAHMWPLTPTRIPQSKEAWLVCLADKWCSLYETLFMRNKH